MPRTVNDPAVATLLELNGSVLDQGDGYWIKIDAWTVAPSAFIPHGVRYSLTLHNRYGTRVLGYDNAHAVRRPNRFKYAGQILPYDHQHRSASDKGIPYEYQDAAQLFEDFFEAVDRVIAESQSP
jgi:hypothetical protein